MSTNKFKILLHICAIGITGGITGCSTVDHTSYMDGKQQGDKDAEKEKEKEKEKQKQKRLEEEFRKKREADAQGKRYCNCKPNTCPCPHKQ